MLGNWRHLAFRICECRGIHAARIQPASNATYHGRPDDSHSGTCRTWIWWRPLTGACPGPTRVLHPWGSMWRNDAWPLGVDMGGVSRAEALVDLGRRRLVTVLNPSLLVALDLSEAILIFTELSTSSLRQCSSLITSWLTRCPSASWVDWVWMSTWVLVAFLYFMSSFFRSSIC